MEFTRSRLHAALERLLSNQALSDKENEFLRKLAQDAVPDVESEVINGVRIQSVFTPIKQRYNSSTQPSHTTGIYLYSFSRESDGETFFYRPSYDGTREVKSNLPLKERMEADHKALLAAVTSGKRLSCLANDSYYTALSGQKTEEKFINTVGAEYAIAHRGVEGMSYTLTQDATVADIHYARKREFSGLDLMETLEDYGGELITDRITNSEFLSRFGISGQDANTLRVALEQDNDQIDLVLNRNALAVRNERLPQGIDQSAFTMAELNFISAGEGDSARYRQQFISRMHQLLDVDNKTNDKHIDKLKKDRTTHTLLGRDTSVSADVSFYSEVFKDKFNRKDNQIITLIDEGKFPMAHLANKFGMNALSKKQFNRAMELVGKRNDLDWNRSMETAMHLSKIPNEWLLETPDPKRAPDVKVNVLDVPSYHDDWKISSRLRDISTSLCLTGKQLDQAQTDGDKPKQKQLAAKWRWLTQNTKKPLHLRVEELSDSLQGDTLNDFGRLCENLMASITLRILNDHSADFSSGVKLNEDLNIEFDEEELTNLLREHLNDEFDEHDYIEQEIKHHKEEYGEELSPDEVFVAYPGDDVETFYEIGTQDFNRVLSEHAVSYKEHLEANHRAHINDGVLRRELAGYSTSNFEWGKFFEGKVEKGDYTVEAIFDKKELLHEANSMDHCVFSYLPKCMSGESIILSVKDKDTGANVATVELSHKGELDYNVEQCFGFKNATVAPEVREAVDAVLSDIEHELLPVNQDIALETDLSHIEEDPLTYGHEITTVPYDTDAVFVALFALEDNLPKQFDFESFVAERSTSLYEIYHDSKFKEQLSQYREVAKKFDMTPLALIREKTRLGATDLQAVHSMLQREDAMVGTITQAIKEYGEHLEPTQLARKVNEIVDAVYGETFLNEELEDALFEQPDIKSIVRNIERREGWFDHGRLQVDLLEAIDRVNKIDDRPERPKLSM